MNQRVQREGIIPSVEPISFIVKRAVLDRQSHVQEIDTHTHREMEVYINLTGDISFLAEDRLYPLSRGDVFLARPGEHHHCVYRSDEPHEFFWILFDCERNRELLDFLFVDPSLNFLSPSDGQKTELFALCNTLLRPDLSEEDRFFTFFGLLQLLKLCASNPLRPQHALSEEVARMVTYVEGHLAEPLSVSAIARDLYISRSTVERRFREALGFSPLEYIRNRKLHEAAALLVGGASVLDAGLSVGYTDTSHFIRLFRDRYGMTPHQYKKTKEGLP